MKKVRQQTVCAFQNASMSSSPYHIELDRLQEESKETMIGTTIVRSGPAYMDKAAQCGWIVDLPRHCDVFAERLRINFSLRKEQFTKLYDAASLFSFDDIFEEYANMVNKSSNM